jgi:hypothetical protein
MPGIRSYLLSTVVAAAALVAPASLQAQACLGNPSFSTNHLQMGAGASFDKSSTSFGGTFVGGSETLFAGVGIGGATYDGVEGSTLTAGGTLGFQVPLSSGSTQVCPIASATFGFGPSDFDGLGTDFSSRAFTFGLSAGGELFRSERIRLVPAVSVGFAYAAGIFDGIAGETTETDTYGVAGAALGVVLSERLSVRPSVSFPIGLEGADPVFGIGFALNYGGRR